jgi:hypothetical protein
LKDASPEGLLAAVLAKWAELVMAKPLIVLFDEVNVLGGPYQFSAALAGVRDLKDYIIVAKGGIAPTPFPCSILKWILRCLPISTKTT